MLHFDSVLDMPHVDAMGRLQSIQILRFVAAAMVVVAHSIRGFSIGAAGVDIFFVISGFIIAHASKGKEAAPFLWRRMLRIYPLYFLCMAPWAYFLIRNTGIDAFKLATSLTLWPVYDDFLFPYLQAGWTLSFEMLFYTCTALTLWRPALLKPLLTGYVVALALAFATKLPLFRFIGNPVIIEFGVGLMIARARNIGPRYGALLIGLGVVGLLLSLPRSPDLLAPEQLYDLTVPDRVLWWGLPAAMLVWGALQFERWLQGRVAKAFAYLGDASYSIYLTHLLTLIVCNLLMPWPLALLCAFIWGIIVHRTVEKPVERILKRKKHTTLQAVAATA